MFDFKIKRNWMKLDPATQYLVWIASLAFMLALSVGGLIALNHFFTLTLETMMVAIGGVIAFSILFVSVVIYLTIIWPHHYHKHNNN